MAEKRKLTQAGIKALEEELHQLVSVERPEYKKQLAEARAEGDLSENADYDAARARQAEVEGRIQEIESLLQNSEVIGAGSKSSRKVSLGTTVKVKNLAKNKEFTYTIVDTVESDPFKGLVSQTSPIGSALIGKVVGNVVDIPAPVPYQVEILEIKID